MSTLAKSSAVQTSAALKSRVISSPVLMLIPILMFAFVLGSIGLDNGLPYSPKADESFFARPASRIAATHNPNPGSFNHPGSTFTYPLALVYKVWGSIAFHVPIWQPNPALGRVLEIDPESATSFKPDWAVYYWLGRQLNVFFFVAGIAVTYLVGVRTWNRRVALLAAWFMAITPVLLSHAQIVRTDQVGLLFFMLACLGCFRLLTSHKWCDYAIAGVVVGVAVSSRYFNLSLAATLIVAHVLSGAHHERGHWKRLIAGLVAIGFGFLITTPAFIFFVEQVFRSLQREARAPVIPLSILERLWWYLSFALPDALSWPIGLLAIVGAFLAQRARNKRAILLLVGSAAFLLTISAPRLYWQRWAAPLIPVGLLFAAGAFWMVVERWKKQHPGFARWERPAAALLVIVLSLLPARESIRYLYTMTQPDTETLAAQWLAANAPPGSRIVREWSTAAIPSDDVSVTYSYFLSSLGPFDETLAHQYDYFVASSYAYEEFFQAAALRVENKESYEKQVEFYRQLFKNELVAQFDPDPWKTAGPTIKIYHMSGRSP